MKGTSKPLRIPFQFRFLSDIVPIWSTSSWVVGTLDNHTYFDAIYSGSWDLICFSHISSTESSDLKNRGKYLEAAEWDIRKDAIFKDWNWLISGRHFAWAEWWSKNLLHNGCNRASLAITIPGKTSHECKYNRFRRRVCIVFMASVLSMILWATRRNRWDLCQSEWCFCSSFIIR